MTSGHLMASGDGELWLMVGEESLDEMSRACECADVKETKADSKVSYLVRALADLARLANVLQAAVWVVRSVTV